MEDQAYWARNLPPESGPHHRLSRAVGEGDLFSAFVRLVRLDSWFFDEFKSYPTSGIMPRSSVTTPLRATFGAWWCAEGSGVVLYFPVSRRVRPQSCKTLPGMVSGVVPLALRVSPVFTVAGFVSRLTREYGKHCSISGFLVHALELKAHPRGLEKVADRVSVNSCLLK